MAQIYMPQKKQPEQSPLADLMNVGKVVGGAFSGNGAMVADGGMGLAGSNEAKNSQQNPAATALQSDNSAMSRRLAAMKEDPQQALRDSMTALQTMPDDVRKTYAQPLVQAYFKSKNGGVA